MNQKTALAVKHLVKDCHQVQHNFYFDEKEKRLYLIIQGEGSGRVLKTVYEIPIKKLGWYMEEFTFSH